MDRHELGSGREESVMMSWLMPWRGQRVLVPVDDGSYSGVAGCTRRRFGLGRIQSAASGFFGYPRDSW